VSTQILLVDDHQIVIDGIRALLATENNVEIKGEAHNGAEALEMLHLLKVDIALMDLDMPAMGGLEATKLIRAKFPEVKIIVLTMHDEKAMVQSMIDAGADGYLLKNSPKAELLRAISAVSGGESYFPAEVKSILLQADFEHARKGKLADLTDREMEILKCIAEGHSNKEIGERLFISHRTVDTHRTNLMQKLDVHNIAGLVRIAITNGLITD
jgi:two-component system nitrate/nitrite response regulator NarL